MRARANLADLDSRIMKSRNGQLQGYNAQVIVGGGQAEGESDVVGRWPIITPKRTCSREPPEGADLLLATSRDHKQRLAMKEAFTLRGRIRQQGDGEPEDGAQASHKTREGAVQVTVKDGGAGVWAD
jgi:hypothetical protein